MLQRSISEEGASLRQNGHISLCRHNIKHEKQFSTDTLTRSGEDIIFIFHMKRKPRTCNTFRNLFVRNFS